MEDHLAHHGVKGMKWGAKREHQEAYRDEMRKRGYDIIVDPEDYSDHYTPHLKDLDAPLIVLDPSKVIGDIREEKTTARRLRKKIGAR